MEIVRVVDLSRIIDSETQVYPGDPVPHIEQHSTIARDGFNLMSVSMGSQSGTHVDAPFHFDESTLTIDEVPLERFVGRGTIVDCRGVGAREAVTYESVASQIDDVAPGDIIIFRTGWEMHYGLPSYFDNPFIDPGLIAALIVRGALTFGIDAINIDETPDATHPGAGFPVHHLIGAASGIICENMCNLHSINFANPVISMLPLKFIGIDGAPVRAVAMDVR